MCQNVSHLNDAMAKKHLIDLVDLEDIKEWFKVEEGQVQMFTINNPGATGELYASVKVVICLSKPNNGNWKLRHNLAVDVPTINKSLFSFVE